MPSLEASRWPETHGPLMAGNMQIQTAGYHRPSAFVSLPLRVSSKVPAAGQRGLCRLSRGPWPYCYRYRQGGGKVDLIHSGRFSVVDRQIDELVKRAVKRGI